MSARPSIVNVERIIDCPFSLVVEEAHLIFPLLDKAGGGGVRVPFRALVPLLPGALSRPVAVTFRRGPDATEPGRLHDEIAFDWKANSLWLPDFSGVLRFRIEALRTRIIMRGEYVPPLGALGMLFDRTVGRSLARATATDVVDRLEKELDALWTAERRAAL